MEVGGAEGLIKTFSRRREKSVKALDEARGARAEVT